MGGGGGGGGRIYNIGVSLFYDTSILGVKRFSASLVEDHKGSILEALNPEPQATL